MFSGRWNRFATFEARYQGVYLYAGTPTTLCQTPVTESGHIITDTTIAILKRAYFVSQVCLKQKRFLTHLPCLQAWVVYIRYAPACNVRASTELIYCEYHTLNRYEYRHCVACSSNIAYNNEWNFSEFYREKSTKSNIKSGKIAKTNLFAL